MATLPARPSLDHLRRQAKALLRAARAGDTTATSRIHAVSERLTLTGAQLAIAREYGFASWARLRVAVEARTMDLAEQVREFCVASIQDWTGRAARMLASTPEIAGYNFATAVILGDAARIRHELARDPGAVARLDAASGWTPLHAVCASRWHQLDPARADGLLAVARLLLDDGADPNAMTSGQRGQPGCWTPLRCAVAGAANPAITRLLLERGAQPDDHDLYLACFGSDKHQCLRLLLDHLPELARSTALAAPISIRDTEGVRLLLAAGADPRRPCPAELYGERYGSDPPWPAVYAALRCGCPTELVELLLDHGADPCTAGPAGLSPYRLATRHGRQDLAALLHRRGARDDTAGADRFLSACLRSEGADARRQLSVDPGLLDRLTAAERGGALWHAAERGNAAAVRLMLDLGLAVDACGGDDGGTALHAAAYAGSAGTVQLLVDRGADLEARDTTWESTPLVWAIIGSGQRPTLDPNPDWVATVRALLDAGAVTHGIMLFPDSPKPPSRPVAELLRGYGIGDEQDEHSDHQR